MIRHYLCGLQLTAAVFLAMSGPTMALGAVLKAGDILVAGRSGTDGIVFEVDPTTGAYTVLSGSAHGSGPAMHWVTSVTLASDGQLWVTDYGVNGVAPQILKIDPTTGNRVALPAAPQGPIMTREVNGRLVVTSPNGIFDVDPVSGASQQISGNSAGSGPGLAVTEGFFVADHFVVSTNSASLVRVDLNTGARQIISAENVGTGPQAILIDVARESDTSLVTTGLFLGDTDSHAEITRVDPLTGNRVVIASPTVGTGAPVTSHPFSDNNPLQLFGIAVGSNGSIFTTASGSGRSELLRIDPVTGDRTVVSNLIAASDRLRFITIVPANVPEPSTVALAVLGAITLLACGRRLK
jgi:predicted small integral membrane protein